MVSVISSVDANLAPVIAQATPPPRTSSSNKPFQATGLSSSPDPEARPRYAEYAKLARTDDQVSEAAKAVREAQKALTKADDAIHTLKDQVQDVIKNFPPFPKNNERVEYLMSINGLRKELQAMSVPPLQDGKEPVFYPQEEKLPVLDPETADEKTLQTYLEVLERMEEKARQGKVVLTSAFEALPKKINQDLVTPLNGEGQAGTVSRDTGDNLKRLGMSLLGDETALAALEQ